MARRNKWFSPDDWFSQEHDYKARLEYEQKLREQEHRHAMMTNVTYSPMYTSATYNSLPVQWHTQQGLIPTAYQLDASYQGGPMTLKAEYVVTDPAAANALMGSTQMALPPAAPKEEKPLAWLDRRVNEVCKVGAIK